MKRKLLALMMLGILSCVTVAASAQERRPTQTTATYSAAAADQAVVVPVRWFGYRYAPGYYGPYYYGYGPYYYPGPYYYYYPAPYGFGFSYSGPRRSFSFGF